MSHFSVLILGDDVEKQLQPYHEYECTGIEDEYVIDINKDDEVKEYLEKELFVGSRKDNGEVDYHCYEEKANEDLVEWKKMTRLQYFQQKGMSIEEIECEIKDWHAFDKKEDGSWYKHTNPNSKWDWWVVGGRWSGFFKLKETSKEELDENEDSFLKRDIDFEKMRNDVAVKAEKRYDAVYKAIKGTEVNESWKSVIERIGDRNKAIDFYNSQERVIAFKKLTEKNDLFGFFASVEEYNIDRDTYIKQERNSAITTYAVVKDGVWYEKGEMGWWGISFNEIEQKEWNERFNELVDSCSDDTLFTLVDAHI